MKQDRNIKTCPICNGQGVTGTIDPAGCDLKLCMKCEGTGKLPVKNPKIPPLSVLIILLTIMFLTATCFTMGEMENIAGTWEMISECDEVSGINTMYVTVEGGSYVIYLGDILFENVVYDNQSKELAFWNDECCYAGIVTMSYTTMSAAGACECSEGVSGYWQAEKTK